MTPHSKPLGRIKKPRRFRSMPLWAHVAVMLAAASALLFGILWLLRAEPTSPLSPAPDDQAVLEVIRLSFYAVAGIGGVVALTVAYRKQRLNESEALRENAKLFNERFAAAAEQLSSERAANRLAGVYALAALADEWREGRQTCVNVLCAYVRMPYEPPPRRAEREAAGPETFKAVLEERLVRRTVIGVIADRLRARQVEGETWHECDFDFTGATLDEGDFSNAVFGGRATFNYVRFPIATFDFNRTRFAGPVSFTKARFSGARVRFGGSTFQDTVDFSSVTVTGGGLHFAQVAFRSGVLRFDKSKFASGAVSFEDCMFADQSVTSFVRVGFSGADVDFNACAGVAARLEFEPAEAWKHPPRFDGVPVDRPGTVELPAHTEQPDGA